MVCVRFSNNAKSDLLCFLPQTSKWRTVRTIIHQLTPFIQIYKQQQYPWVQLAGHQGNFKPGGKPGTILKKYCQRERQACEKLQQDFISEFVPFYYGVHTDSDGTGEYN